jgi:hypothetical protein
MWLKENTTYRLRNGWIVNDLVRRDGGDFGDYFEPRLPVDLPPFDIPFPMWKMDGRWDAFTFDNSPEFDIVEEV